MVIPPVMGWRAVPGFAGIYAHRDGAIGRMRGGIIQPAKPFVNSNGYFSVKCCNKPLPVHRAVAMAWIEQQDHSLDVNHIDGDKKNNAVENLEWCTRAENIRHALAHGLHASPETPVIGIHRDTGHVVRLGSQASCKALGFQQPLVNKCLKGERKHHRGYIWRYAA